MRHIHIFPIYQWSTISSTTSFPLFFLSPCYQQCQPRAHLKFYNLTIAQVLLNFISFLPRSSFLLFPLPRINEKDMKNYISDHGNKKSIINIHVVLSMQENIVSSNIYVYNVNVYIDIGELPLFAACSEFHSSFWRS